MPKAATPITLTKIQRAELQSLVRAARSPQQTVLRARILLRADDGEDNTRIAAALKVGANTVAKWRGRFAAAGLAGLSDAARSGRPARLAEAVVQRVLTEVTRPPRRPFQKRGPTALGAQRFEAPPAAHFQSLPRPAFRAEVLGRQRPLPRPAAQGAGALLR